MFAVLEDAEDEDFKFDDDLDQEFEDAFNFQDSQKVRSTSFGKSQNLKESQ